jgi:hypothetical protein
MYSINIENYSDKSFVVRGSDTIKFKDTLKEFGGKWNSMLKNGGGWIFSNIHKEKIESFINIINYTREEKNKEELSQEEISISEIDDNKFIVKGNTKIYKDKFKNLGGKWNIKEKGWIFNNESLKDVDNIIDEYEEIMSVNL